MTVAALIKHFLRRWFGPALLTLALLVTLVLLFLAIERRNLHDRRERLLSHGTVTARGLQLKLRSDGEFLQLLANGMARGMLNVDRFDAQVRSYVTANPAILRVSWLGEELDVRWSAPVAADADRAALERLLTGLAAPRQAAQMAWERRQPVCSRPFLAHDKQVAAVLFVPVYDGERFLGMVTAQYALESLLRTTVAAETLAEFQVCLIEPRAGMANVCVGSDRGDPREGVTVPLDLQGAELELVFRPHVGATDWGARLLQALVLALAAGLGWGSWLLQQDIALRRRIQVDLQSHLNLLQTIMSATPDAVYVKDGAGVYQLINRVGARLLGRQAHEVVGSRDEEFLPAEAARRTRQGDLAVIAAGRPLTQEEQVETAEGSRYLLTTRTPYRDERGNVAGLVGVARDITERKAAERVLAESERRFRTIFESAAIGAATLLPDGRFLQVNRSLCIFLGYEEAELRRLRLDETVAEEGRELVRRLMAEALTTGRSMVRRDNRFRRRDGSLVWGQLTATLVLDSDQRPDYWVAQVQDIDARISALHALQQSEERYRLLFSASSDPILVYEADSGHIAEANFAAQELFGYDAEELCSMSLAYLFDAGVSGNCQAADLLAPPLRRVPLATLRDAGGRRIPVEIAAGRFAWQGREMAVAILRDVTERQRLERLKDEMLSSVSHEMRTPLTAMLGFSEFLLDNPVGPKQQREYLAIIHKETIRLKDLIDNLLNLQRLRAGFGLIATGSVAVPALLHDMTALFASSSAKHRLRIDCEEELPSLEGDESQLCHALRNLVSNAIKYSPDGGDVVLGARRAEGGIRIWVRDQGMGVPDAARGRIFERFYRVARDGHGRIGGTGLGLPLVKEIVELHGGRVWLESPADGGSRFCLWLPLRQPKRPAAK